jgi:hypothetical protein
VNRARRGTVRARARPRDDNRVMATFATDVEISQIRPGSPEACTVLTDYFREVASRIYGREATDAELEAEMRADPSDYLCPPGGLFLVARAGQTVIGCVALRLLPGGLGEIMRVFVEPPARNRGMGAQSPHITRSSHFLG